MQDFCLEGGGGVNRMFFHDFWLVIMHKHSSSQFSNFAQAPFTAVCFCKRFTGVLLNTAKD